MDCAICRRPLSKHDSALRVLGELPFETVKSVLQHQWQKDTRRIIFSHAEHYHDETIFNLTLSHKKQLEFLKADLERHRAKYIMHYLHAIVEVYREDEVGATRVTMEDEIAVRLKLEKALSYQLPSNLDTVFRNEKPFEWTGALTWEQSKQRREDLECSSGMMFAQGYGPEVIERRLITVISMTVRLNGDEGANGRFIMFIPKTPDPMWCWSQTTENIQLFQNMTRYDLF